MNNGYSTQLSVLDSEINKDLSYIETFCDQQAATLTVSTSRNSGGSNYATPLQSPSEAKLVPVALSHNSSISSIGSPQPLSPVNHDQYHISHPYLTTQAQVPLSSANSDYGFHQQPKSRFSDALKNYDRACYNVLTSLKFQTSDNVLRDCLDALYFLGKIKGLKNFLEGKSSIPHEIHFDSGIDFHEIANYSPFLILAAIESQYKIIRQKMEPFLTDRGKSSYPESLDLPALPALRIG